MLEAYPQLKGMYAADDDNCQVLYLKDATATFSSFGGEPEVIKFWFLLDVFLKNIFSREAAKNSV